jgi:hypothetical protein
MLKSTYTNIYASTNPTTHIDTLYKRPKRRILIQTPNLKFQKISNQYHLHWSIPCLPPVCPGRYKYKYEDLSLYLKEKLIFCYWMLRIQTFPLWGKIPKDIIRIILNHVCDNEIEWHNFVECSYKYNNIKCSSFHLDYIIGFNRVCQWTTTLSVSPDDNNVCIAPPFTKIQIGNRIICRLTLEKGPNMTIYDSNGSSTVYGYDENDANTPYTHTRMVISPHHLWQNNNRSGLKMIVAQMQILKGNELQGNE